MDWAKPSTMGGECLALCCLVPRATLIDLQLQLGSRGSQGLTPHPPTFTHTHLHTHTRTPLTHRPQHTHTHTHTHMAKALCKSKCPNVVGKVSACTSQVNPPTERGGSRPTSVPVIFSTTGPQCHSFPVKCVSSPSLSRKSLSDGRC